MGFMRKHPDLIREYARLIVRTGVNIQEHQGVVVSSNVEHYAFARMVVEEAYAAGAKEVVMQWNDQPISKQFFLHADEECLSNIPDYRAEITNYPIMNGYSRIGLTGSDPAGMEGIDFGRVRTYRRAMSAKTMASQKKLMASEIAWTVAAVPQVEWAKKVFPDVSVDEAMDLLWEKILYAVRITEGGDAVAAWDAHAKNLKANCDRLNAAQYCKLHYKNSLGTDFVVGLVENHIWEGGAEVSGTGVTFEANLPTEEIFTMPDRRVAEGTLVSSRPLSYQGTLIKNFSLTFQNGAVVDFQAEEGYEALKSLVETSEGTRHLGEVAIVPYSSPISQMGVLFYETLFDENASCHFALGNCYPTTIRGGENFSDEEMMAHGGNICPEEHVDFMVGTADLTITGISADGTETVIFESGEWVEK